MATDGIARWWAARRVLARQGLGVLRENANGLTVLVGAGWLYVGIHGVSPPAADIVAGVILMALGLRPYLSRARRP